MKKPDIELDKTTKAYLIQILTDYPQMKKSLETDIRNLMPSSTPNYESAPVMSGGESRPTEGLAIRMISDQTLALREWKIQSVECLLTKIDEIDRQIIALCFWNTPQCSMEKAGEIINMTAQGVKYRIDNMAILLAYYYGEGKTT